MMVVRSAPTSPIRFWSRLLSAIIGGWFGLQHLNSQTVPDATWSEFAITGLEYQGGFNSYSAPVSFTQDLNGSFGDSMENQVLAAGGPTFSFSDYSMVNLTSGSQLTSHVDASSTYFSFEIEGPTPSVSVTLNASGTAAAIVTGTPWNATAEAGFTLGDQGDYSSNIASAGTFISLTSPNLNSADVTGGPTTGYIGGFTEAATLVLQTNTIYSASFGSEIGSATFSPLSNDSATFQTSVSIPTFAIDPSVSNAGAYSIIESQNLTSIPEIPSEALTLGAVALIAASRSRANGFRSRRAVRGADIAGYR